MLKKKFILFVAIVLELILLLTGCKNSNISGQVPETNASGIATYTIADSNGDWGFPTPWGHYQRGPGYIRMSLIFDTLVWKDKQGYIPALAMDWNYDAETKTYTFDLRNDVFWHDGQKLTADDVVFTVDYMQEHPYPWVDLSVIEEIKISAENQIKITLKEDYAPFLANIAATLPIIPRHIWQDVQDPAKFTGSEAAIGSGPFKYADYNREQGTYLYTANENYYGGEVLVQQLKFVKLNAQLSAAALKKREVDAVAVQPEMAEQLQEDYVVLTETGSSNVKLMFNQHKAPLDSKEFRKALAYMINREELVAKAVRGYGLPGNPWLYTPQSKWFNQDAEQYEYNPAKGQQLLEQLGYEFKKTSEQNTEGIWVKNGQELELTLLCDANLLRAAEVIKEQLSVNGIKIEIQNVETKTRDARILAWDFDLALNFHGGLGSDPNLLSKFLLAEDFNSARYQENTQLVDLLKKQAEVMDEQERIEIVRRIQDILAEEVPFLTLYYPKSYWLHNGKADLFYTPDGIGIGIPLPLNKESFVR